MQDLEPAMMGDALMSVMRFPQAQRAMQLQAPYQLWACRGDTQRKTSGSANVARQLLAKALPERSRYPIVGLPADNLRSCIT